MINSRQEDDPGYDALSNNSDAQQEESDPSPDISAEDTTPEPTTVIMPETEPMPELTAEPVPELTNEPETEPLPVLTTAPATKETIPRLFALPLEEAGSIVVYSFSELSTALSNNNGYTKIYLGNNIVMQSGGIAIHSSKASVIIDGINPLEPERGMHTLTDYSSSSSGDTIRVENSGTKNVTLRNLNIVGKNYYGTVYVSSTYSGVTTTYENVKYSGSQLTYNRNGTAVFMDCTISNTSTAASNEVGEVKNVIIGGITALTNASTSSSLLWFVGSAGSLEVLPDANVTLTSQNNYLIYSDGGVVQLMVGENATLKITTESGTFYNSTSGVHSFGNATIEKNATLDITQSERNALSAPSLKLYGNLVAKEGSNLFITVDYTPSDPLIRFYTSGGSATFTDPGAVKLSNAGAKIFSWNTGSGHIIIDAGVFNYHTAVRTREQLSSFSVMPDVYCIKRDGSNMALDILASSTATTSVASNFVSGTDYGIAPTATSISVNNCRMLTFGSLPLTIDTPVTNNSKALTGQTDSYVNVKAEYDGAKILYGHADSLGNYSLMLPEGTSFDVDSEVKVTAHKEYIITTTSSIVEEAPSGILSLVSVPSVINFESTHITNHEVIVHRQQPDFSIQISDTRGVGLPYSLLVSVKKPLHYVEGGEEYALQDALVFVDNAGATHTLSDTSTKIYSGTKIQDEMTLEWSNDSGLLIRVFSPLTRVDNQYTATLMWTLTDTP